MGVEGGGDLGTLFLIGEGPLAPFYRICKSTLQSAVTGSPDNTNPIPNNPNPNPNMGEH